MRIAVLDETSTVTNVIVCDGEAVLPSLGITNYKVLTDDQAIEIGTPYIEEPVQTTNE